MPKAAVTGRQLVKVEGIEEVLQEIKNRISELRYRGGAGDYGKAVKQLFYEAAEPIEKQAKQNIDRLAIGRTAQRILKQQIVRGRGPRRHPNAFVTLYQWAAETTGGGSRIPNPYWFEYGTHERRTKRGRRTGQMRPTPFFRPAITQARNEVKALLIEGLRRLIVAGKG